MSKTDEEFFAVLSTMPTPQKQAFIEFVQDFITLKGMTHAERSAAGEPVGQRILTSLSAPINVKPSEVQDILRDGFKGRYLEIFPFWATDQ